MHLLLSACMTEELGAEALGRLGGRECWGITPSDPMGTTVRRVSTAQGGNRIVVGEGKPWQRIGRDPQVLIGSVLMGSGFTMLHDPRRHGYKIRATVVLLLAPMMSLLRGAAGWELSAGWLLAARTASVIFAAANLSLAVVTLIRGSTSVRRRRLQRRLLTELAHPDTE